MRIKYSLFRGVSGTVLICIAANSFAQQNISGAILGPGVGNAPPTTINSANQGFNDAPSTEQRAWTIKPRIALTETLTDNVSINRSANGKQSDLITQLTPGIRIEGNSPRLKAHFDYALNGQFFARTDYSRTQNALNTFGTLEAVDNWLYLDFSGVIAQQAISAFGVQSPSNTSINENTTETATYRLSPHMRGQIGGLVNYLLRYNWSTTTSNSTKAYNVDISQWSGQLRGSTPFQNLNWTIDGNQQTSDYSSGRTTDAQALRGMGTYSIFPQFRISLSGGAESNNYASLKQETHPTYGYGFDWTPTERTQASAFMERRFFGDAHNIVLSHRFPMSSIRYSDTRTVSVLPNQFASVGLGNVFDLYFEQFSNMIPDPVSRATFVNALLAQQGINPNTLVTGGFLTSRATVQRRQQLSLSLVGARNIITLLASRNENQSILASTEIVDDFANNQTIRQKGLSLNLSHRLSEISNLNFLASRQESIGNGIGTNKVTTTIYQANISTKLGAKSTGSLSVRRSEFDSSTNPYTENALLGTLSFVY